MRIAFQPSLLDEAVPALGSLADLRRTTLSAGAWIDVLPGWLSGADEIFERLVSAVPWRSESREMYDRVVDVPRLVHTYGLRDVLPEPVLEQAREALSDHFAPELGEPFVTAGCCYYRDGNDSGRLARRQHRPRPDPRHDGRDPVPRVTAQAAAASARRQHRAVPRPRSRRPGGDGRVRSEDLGAFCSQDEQGCWAPH